MPIEEPRAMYRTVSKKAASLTRQQLYDMVWAEPMRLLAPRYGISDVGLAKICRRAAIPLPPAGYWAKIRHGKRVKRPSLPDKPTGCIDPLRIAASGHRNEDLELNLPSDIRKAIDAEREETIAMLGVKGRRLHPIVDRWLAEDARSPGIGHYRPQRPRFSKIERRRLRFVSLLLQELERRGGTVEPDSRWKFRLKLAGESLTISVDEALKQVRVPTEHGYYGRDYRIENQGTGELRLRIERYFDKPIRKQWRDLSDKPLEHQVREIIVGALFACAAVREERLAREERAQEQARAEARRQAEELRLREERAKLESLVGETASWIRARDIRLYFAAALRAGAKCRQERGKLSEWAKWARMAADSIDPLCPR